MHELKCPMKAKFRMKTKKQKKTKILTLVSTQWTERLYPLRYAECEFTSSRAKSTAGFIPGPMSPSNGANPTITKSSNAAKTAAKAKNCANVIHNGREVGSILDVDSAVSLWSSGYKASSIFWWL